MQISATGEYIMTTIMFIFWLGTTTLTGGSVNLETREFTSFKFCETAKEVILSYYETKFHNLVIVCVIK